MAASSTADASAAVSAFATASMNPPSLDRGVVSPSPSSHTRTANPSAVAKYSGYTGLNATPWTFVPLSHALNCAVGCTSSPPVTVRS